MPKSKRDKPVSLTQTNKKGMVLKQHIIEDIKKCAEEYSRIFIISVQNSRNSKLLRLRAAQKSSRFFFGKTRILTLGLKLALKTETADDVKKLCDTLKNNSMNGLCGLLFTNSRKISILKWMKEFKEEEYARSGFVSPELIELPAGPLPFQNTLEPYLRKLGMPTALQQGSVTVIRPYKICQKGDVLTPEQAQILKLLGKPLAVFKVIALGIYTKKYGFEKSSLNNEEEMDAEHVDNLDI